MAWLSVGQLPDARTLHDPPEFVVGMEKHVGRMEDAAFARLLHHFERENMRGAARVTRFYMAGQ
jgi:hypothetical protein